MALTGEVGGWLANTFRSNEVSSSIAPPKKLTSSLRAVWIDALDLTASRHRSCLRENGCLLANAIRSIAGLRPAVALPQGRSVIGLPMPSAANEVYVLHLPPYEVDLSLRAVVDRCDRSHRL